MFASRHKRTESGVWIENGYIGLRKGKGGKNAETGKKTAEVKCQSHHFISGVCIIKMIWLFDIDFYHLAKVVSYPL